MGERELFITFFPRGYRSYGARKQLLLLYERAEDMTPKIKGRGGRKMAIWYLYSHVGKNRYDFRGGHARNFGNLR